MNTERPSPARKRPLRRLHRQLALVIIVYFFAGGASQKLIPGVDEIFPFFGWSLFSKVPDEERRYTILIEAHEGRPVAPPVAFLRAPESMVTGNRYIARKVIQKLGRAQERNQEEEVERLRGLLEQGHLRGRMRYELVFERYDPLEKWKTGESLERRSVCRFERGRKGAVGPDGRAP